MGILVAAGAAVIIVLGVWFTVLFDNPRRQLPSQDPAAFDLPFQDVTLTTQDGEMLAAWVVPPPSDEGAVVIYVHGRSGNREQLLPQAAALYEAGYGAVLFDVRKHGASSKESRLTYGINEVYDVQAAVDYIRARPGGNTRDIAIMGHSLGASISLLSAEQIDDIGAVVALSPYSSITEVIGDRVWYNYRLPPRPTRDLIIGFVGVLTRVDYAPACPRCSLPGQPVLLVHGNRDADVPYTSAERILAAAGDNVTFWHLEGVDHMSDEWVLEHRMQDVVAFLDDALRTD